MKNHRWKAYISAACLGIVLLSAGCEPPFTFPAKEVFSLHVEAAKDLIPLGSDLVLECTIHNNTNRTFAIISGSSIVFFEDDIMASAAKYETLYAKETKTETLSMAADEKGWRTVSVFPVFTSLIRIQVKKKNITTERSFSL